MQALLKELKLREWLNSCVYRTSERWSDYVPGRSVAVLRRGRFDIREPSTIADTFLDLAGWKKGAAFLNGFLLGRYWNLGPQRTFYVPWPLLKVGENELIVFETEQASDKVTFVEQPVLDSLDHYDL
jgi:beta-galactosidase GanA